MFYQLVKSNIRNKTQQTYKRGQIIYHEGENPEYIYFIESGIVGLFHMSESGKETFFRVFGKDDILGHRSYFAEEPYHASSVALSHVTLVLISKNECHRICEENPQLLREVAGKMARDLRRAELRMAGLLDKTAHKRISESLVFLKLKYPNYVWTRKEIAEYSGSTFETVTRVMSVLEKKDLIEKQGRDFQILNHDLLLSLSEEDLH
jgi:CRP-like cAMP-binding protein